MPPAKPKAADSDEPKVDKATAKDIEQALDGAGAGLEQGVDDGYLGTKVDPLPNSEHSLESGPDAPSAAEQAAALAEAQGPTR